MLMEVQDFCRRVEGDLPRLIAELQGETGRYGQEEYEGWGASLSSAARVLNSPVLQHFHLHVGQRGGISIEYRLPCSSSWCDLVLLGRGADRPAAVIVELKHWDTYGDIAGPTEALVMHHGELHLHPSDQVRGYAQYCERFHSAVLDWKADVSGCAYFTVPQSGGAFLGPPHDRLVAEYPVFADQILDPDERFAPYLAGKLRGPDVAFAEAFERGTYRQDRGFCEQIAKQIATPGESPFVLLDHQRKAFELCRAEIDAALRSSEDRKTVVIVDGPPGSGKSVVAARLWAELRRDSRLSDHDCVITTTSAAQRNNWQRLFERTRKGAAGIVMPASRFAPADLRWVGRYKDQHGDDSMSPARWRENVEICRRIRYQLGPADAPLVAIVDEAHALINPEHPKARTPAGYPVAFGPQAWHIIRGSRVVIFLLDPAQSFRDRETTTPQDIDQWAKEQGAHVAPRVSLAGLQFRAAGSVEYADWVDGLLGFRATAPRGSVWRTSSPRATGKLLFEIVSVRGTLSEAKRERRNGHQGPGYGELVRRTRQAYRILLTRAMKGVYVWFEDDETRNYVRRLLRDPLGDAGDVPYAG